MQDSKTYLNVPYAEKDAAKTLGAKWDRIKKQWYAPANTDIALFEKWQSQSTVTGSSVTPKSKVRQGVASRNVILGVSTYGKNKDLVACSDDEPPWDS
ncbi:MAG: hypothetical protein GQ583_05635 [Methyloprofundus sp.]|nr:hypothetical protein [Methyloprofundus sp.]